MIQPLPTCNPSTWNTVSVVGTRARLSFKVLIWRRFVNGFLEWNDDNGSELERKWKEVVTVCFNDIQGVPGVVTTSGFNSRADSESKMSYTHGYN
jgi:hypothetical protein